MAINQIFAICPTPAIALHRLKVNAPALLVVYVAFHADLYRWLSRDVMAALGRSVLGISRESTRDGLWWLERIPYTILIFNIIHASISLIKLQSMPPPTSIPPSQLDSSLFQPTKITTPQNRAYVPSPSGKDRPGLGRPSTPSSLRLRSSPIQSTGTSHLVSNQVTNTTSASNPNIITQPPNQTPIKSNQNQSNPHQTNSPTKPSSPTLNDLLLASTEKHRDRVARVQASSKFLSSSTSTTGSPLGRSIIGKELGKSGYSSLNQSAMAGVR